MPAPQLVRVVPSPRQTKKYMAVFSDGQQVHFGGKGCGDFIQYQRLGKDFAARKRRAYIARHARGGEDWRNPMSPGALSRWLLWEYPTLPQAIKKYSLHVR